jgi:hypothetical protein
MARMHVRGTWSDEWICQDSRREGEHVMADILYLGVALVFFWLSVLLVRLCERL